MAPPKPVDAPRRSGRPPAGPYQDKRNALSTRITTDLRDKLDAAAKASGRSLSQEIELRLQRTFEREDSLYEAFGGRRSFTLGKVIANVVSLIEASSGKNWRSHRRTFEEVQSAVMKVLEALGPTKKTPADQQLERQAEVIGDILAGAVVEGSDFAGLKTLQAVMNELRQINTLSSQALSEARVDDQLQREGKATSKKVSKTSS